MAVTEYHCTVSLDDSQLGDGASSIVTVAQANRVYLPIVLTSTVGVNIDTSGLAGQTITAATFYWYNDIASVKSKDATWSHRIYIVGQATIYSNTAGAEAAGWNSHALTAGELAWINKAGDTGFVFTVDDPGSPNSRTWYIRQWDHLPTGDYSAYLEVTHNTPTGYQRKIIIV